MAAAIIPALISAGASIYAAKKDRDAADERAEAISGQSDSLNAAQQANIDQLNEYLDNLEPNDLVGQTVDANQRNRGSIADLGRFFANAFRNLSLSAGQDGVDFLTDNFLGSSERLGINIPDLTTQIQEEAQRELQEGTARQEGRYFNDTPVGRQRVREMFRTMAPRFSPQSLDTFGQNFAGANNTQEVDAITEFFGVAQNESRYGDLQVGNALTRLGGVLDYSRQTALPIADRGLAFGEGVGNQFSAIARSQLLSPSDTLQARNIQATSALGVLNTNNEAAGGIAKAAQAAATQQAGASAAQNEAISSGIGEIAKAIFSSGENGTSSGGSVAADSLN